MVRAAVEKQENWNELIQTSVESRLRFCESQSEARVTANGKSPGWAVMSLRQTSVEDNNSICKKCQRNSLRDSSESRSRPKKKLIMKRSSLLHRKWELPVLLCFLKSE